MRPQHVSHDVTPLVSFPCAVVALSKRDGPKRLAPHAAAANAMLEKLKRSYKPRYGPVPTVADVLRALDESQETRHVRPKLARQRGVDPDRLAYSLASAPEALLGSLTGRQIALALARTLSDADLRILALRVIEAPDKPITGQFQCGRLVPPSICCPSHASAGRLGASSECPTKDVGHRAREAPQPRL